MHLNSLLIFREHVAPRIPSDARVLELGADGSPSTYCREAGLPPHWETADLVSEAGRWNADQSTAAILMPSQYEIPVPGNTYDIVFSGQVIEHVREVWVWMRELARVTKPGGLVITISPISWEYHEAPIDCWRMYPAAAKAVANHAGLEVEHCWWGSLEPKPSRRTYPGNGADWAQPRSQVQRAVRRLVGWPASISYDMVTIARKPGHRAA